jgi:hypothetical protein
MRGLQRFSLVGQTLIRWPDTRLRLLLASRFFLFDACVPLAILFDEAAISHTVGFVGVLL